MALACTAFKNGKFSAVQSFVSTLAFSVLIVILACMMQIAGSGKAWAEEFQHEHSAGSSVSVQNDVMVHLAMPAPVVNASQNAEVTDCDGHEGHKNGSGSKKCCVSMCCAADSVWNGGYGYVPVEQISPLWLFSRQFLALAYASGLDRPPDFRT